MGKMGDYQPEEKFKNYSLPTSKAHGLYKEKVWTLPEQIHKRLKKIAEFLERLYPTLTDDFSKNIKVVIEKNLNILINDLDLMQHSLDKKPGSFNIDKLKVNQKCITEMKNVCDTLQTVSTYEYESKNLGKVKHALHELEHLIQPTSFESGLEKARVVSSKPKIKPKVLSAKKEHMPVKSKKASKQKSVVKPTQKVSSKKAKPTTKLTKPKKPSSTKKTTKPKSKSSTEKTLKVKPKSKRKSSVK